MTAKNELEQLTSQDKTEMNRLELTLNAAKYLLSFFLLFIVVTFFPFVCLFVSLVFPSSHYFFPFPSLSSFTDARPPNNLVKLPSRRSKRPRKRRKGSKKRTPVTDLLLVLPCSEVPSKINKLTPN